MYAIPLGGTLLKVPYSIGGSGSAYITGVGQWHAALRPCLVGMGLWHPFPQSLLHAPCIKVFEPSITAVLTYLHPLFISQAYVFAVCAVALHAAMEQEALPYHDAVCLATAAVSGHVRAVKSNPHPLSSPQCCAGWCDRYWRDDFTEEEARQFVVKALTFAMARDASSGGCVRTVTITQEGVKRDFIPSPKLAPTFGELPVPTSVAS